VRRSDLRRSRADQPRGGAAVAKGKMAEQTDPIRPRWSIAPYFVVDDVVATANYYRDTLGFQYERFWNEPPSFCMVYRSGVVIMLAQGDKNRARHLRPAVRVP
jgi:hypothetical protein